MSFQARLLLLSLLLFHTAFSQTGFYKSYTLPAEGTTPVINALYETRTGYILVAASTGLYRFDGTGFLKMAKDTSVPDDVTAVCETKDGKTWIGFGDGKLGWLQGNRLVLQDPEEGLPRKSVRKIRQDAAGVVWIATAGEGIYYYQNKRFYNINVDDGLSDNYVYDIAATPVGLFAGTDGGINQVRLSEDVKQVSTFSSKNGLPDNIVRALAFHTWKPEQRNSFHHLFVGMQDAGLGHFAPPSQMIADRGTPGWAYGQINDLLLVHNTLYAGTEQSGLVRFDLVNDRPANAYIAIRHKINSLLHDREGNVWAAGNNQLFRTNGDKLKPVVMLQPAEAANLHTLLIDRENHLWYNVPKGLKHLHKDREGKIIERIYTLPVSINSQITALYEDKHENIWIGTMGSGAFLLNPSSGRFRKINEHPVLQQASVLSISGKDDQVWIASLEGAMLCRLEPRNVAISEMMRVDAFTAAASIGTNYIYNIFPDSRNRTWFATDGKGIAVLENGRVRSYTQSEGLKSEVVYQIAEDPAGNIWFTTFNAGLVKFDGKQFRHFTTTDGLSDLNITSLTADQKGNLYLSHSRGIDIINTATHTITYLDEEQGLATVNTDLNTITTCSKGDVYFIANNAIYKYAASRLPAGPKIIIDRVQLFLDDVAVKDGHVFGASEDNISFYYTGLYYSQPQKIHYQYKLEGFGNEWITTNDRRRDFPKLAPGEYTFKVRASLNRNFENSPETSFRFTIQRPLWMRWWFIILFFTVLGLLLYYYIKGREQRLQKLERLEKEKIQSQFETLRNQVNPHFLFNSFNTLISEIEDDPRRAVAYVEHMADFFRSIVTYREKDVITLAEEIHIIKDYLFIQQKRYGNAFQVQISISTAEEQQYYLAPLTLQLLAENAIKHNAVLKEKPLTLEVFVEADQLVVRNNINPKLHPEKSAGLGLQNIRRRYGLLTKQPVIVTNDEEYFTVIIPLIKNADDNSVDHRG